MTTTTLPAGARPSTTRNVLLWVGQVVLAALFVFAGGMKLVTPIAEMQQGGMALPGALLRFIGVAEVLGGLGLILPGALRIRQELTPLAAAGLTLIMAGAVVVTLMTPQASMAVMPLVVGIIAALIAYNRWRMLPR